MQTWQIPQTLIDILDKEAGKMHSREGVVLVTLAKILTKYDQIRNCPECQAHKVAGGKRDGS